MRTRDIIMVIGASLIAGTAGAATYLLTGSDSIPASAEAVKDFDAARYMGKWYEIARFDFKFEKDLALVTADYSENPDGSIKVVNSGYNTEKEQWQSAVGKAVFAKTSDIGMLKVSFFGPFYSGYNVVAIDKEYKYAMVFGKNLNYLWLLSREKTMPKAVIENYLEIAANAGYDLSRLVWTAQ